MKDFQCLDPEPTGPKFLSHSLFNKYWLMFLTQKLFPCSPFP